MSRSCNCSDNSGCILIVLILILCFGVGTCNKPADDKDTKAKAVEVEK